MKGKLYLIPTFLTTETSRQTIPDSVQEVVIKLTHYFAENVRTARRFISALKLGVDIESLQFQVLDKDASSKDLIPFFELINKGIDVGVLSEAGCPGVADPGALAVEMAHKQGIEVIPLVGPSSILLALMASGFSGQSFVFIGYIPIDKAERAKSIKQIEKDAQVKRQTQIFIETPYRNNGLLSDLLAHCNGNTRLCVASDITAPTQFIKTLAVNDWKKITIDLNKRPTVFLLF